MSPTRRVIVGVALLGLVGVALGVALVGATPGVSADQGSAVGAPETDNTVTRIQVRPDGSARWTVKIRTRLATEDEVAAYESFQERFRANRSTFRERFRAPMERIVAAAADETGREMAATNVTASTEVRTVPRRWGVVTYGFTWEGFARQTEEGLRAGDAFQSGFFIAANDTLQLVAPEGYGLESVEPVPNERANGTATWTGRVDFGRAQPAATMVPTDPDTGGDSPLVLGVAALVVLVAVAGGVWFWRDDSGDAAHDGDGVAVGGDRSAAGEIPEPVADDARIRQLLAASGGRMRQADIVDEVDWSKSKVSRVVSDLADRGVVQKVRIGRENVVELADGDNES